MDEKLFADLHNHTTASDGDFTPENLVEQARKLGINAIGITDHDTLGGLAAGVAAGEKHGVEVVPGVEVSIRFKRPYFTGTLHLLCYFSLDRLKDDQFVADFNRVLARGRGEKLVKARVAEVNRVFGPDGKTPVLKRDLKFEDIANLSPNATRRHFALALEHSLGITDAQTIHSIIGNDSPAYLPSGIDLAEILPFIRMEKTVFVLAHPAAGSFPGNGHYKEVLPPIETVEKILPEFIEAGIHGLEVYYPGHIQAHQELMRSWAQKYHLILTGGSDCHDGKDRPMGVKGMSEAEYNVFKEALA